MKKKCKKMLIGFFLVLTTLFTECKIKAYECKEVDPDNPDVCLKSSRDFLFVEGTQQSEEFEIDTTGTGTYTTLGAGACGTSEDNPYGNGCASHGRFFVLRVGLFTKDENGYHHVKGTDVVEIEPDYGGYFTNSRNVDNGVEFNKFIDETGDNYSNVNFEDYRYMIEYSGMHTDRAGTAECRRIYGTTSYREWAEEYGCTKTLYKTNMGLVYGDEEKSISEKRQKLSDYIQSGEKKNQVPGENRYVSFSEFVLKAVGFTEDWELTDADKRKLSLEDYYIITEPIYQVGMVENGRWQVVKGTPAQILSWAEKNATWNYWIAYAPDIAFNFLCNFYDTGFESKSNCTTIEENIEFYNRMSGKQRTEFFNTYFYSQLENPKNQSGLNAYALSKMSETEEVSYDCNYRVTTCNDNNFIFKSTLSFENYKTSSSSTETGGEISAATVSRKKLTDRSLLYQCIYPEQGVRDNLKSYVYTPERSPEGMATGDYDLWCYDDVTYNFSELKKLQGKQYIANTYAEIPNGTLKVNRTCYTKNPNIDDGDSILNSLLITDDIENGTKKYQQEFNFNFNNQQLKFVIDNEKGVYHGSTDNSFKKEVKQAGINTIDYIIYTSEFYYDYVIANGTNSNDFQANIQLNNNAINLNTNTVEFLKDFENSRVIKLKDSKQYKYNVKNTMSPNLNNAAGLSNYFINKVGNGASFTATEKEVRTGVDTEISIKTSYNIIGSGNGVCEITTDLKPSQTQIENKTQFRVISLDNPFPGRDGRSRLAGDNWLNDTENNVFNYITLNRNVETEKVYEKQPIYKVTLTPQQMIKIREYNKGRSYSETSITCEEGTGRMCKSSFIRNSKYVKLKGTCSTINDTEITTTNRNIKDFIDNCSINSTCVNNNQDLVTKYDTNKDGNVTKEDYLTADFYTCADKTYKSGG